MSRCKKLNVVRYSTGGFILSFVLITVLSLAFLPTSANALDKIVFGDAGWDSSLVENRIAGFIISHGYNCKVDYQYTSTPVIYESLGRGDMQVYMESWTSANEELYIKGLSSNEFVDLGPAFPDTSEGWYVPTYVIEGDEERGIEPMAPDLKSVEDLSKYWKLFKDPEQPDKGRFYNCPISWTCYGINEERLIGYGLDEYYTNFNPGSGASLASEIIAKYRKGEPILTYYWEPTKVMGMLDLTKLEEPEYSPEVWESTKACAYAPTKVHVLVHPSLSESPQIMSFLANYQITLSLANELLAYMDTNDADAEEAAKWFLKNKPRIWHEWIPVRGSYRKQIVKRIESAL